jgi:uncharacterized protein YyaL (SSP411 family)
MAQHPQAFGHLLGVADTITNGAVELAIIGDPGDPRFVALVNETRERYLPALALAGGEAGPATEGIGLLDQREARGGAPTAYVCRNYACDEPVTDPDALGDQLDRVSRASPR